MFTIGDGKVQYKYHLWFLKLFASLLSEEEIQIEDSSREKSTGMRKDENDDDGDRSKRKIEDDHEGKNSSDEESSRGS